MYSQNKNKIIVVIQILDHITNPRNSSAFWGVSSAAGAELIIKTGSRGKHPALKSTPIKHLFNPLIYNITETNCQCVL